jgi:hypothetical protein
MSPLNLAAWRENATAMRKLGLAEIGSAVAVIVSALALFVSFYQAKIAERQAHASVWPYVSIDYDINDQGDRSGFIWTVQNNGLGPALIQSVIVSVDGQPQQDWKGVCRALGIKENFASTMSEVSGRVLPPDTNRETTIDAIHVISPGVAKVFFENRKRLSMEICYCSVYEECWVAHFGKQKVDKVDRCDTSGTVQFTQ